MIKRIVIVIISFILGIQFYTFLFENTQIFIDISNEDTLTGLTYLGEEEKIFFEKDGSSYSAIFNDENRENYTIDITINDGEYICYVNSNEVEVKKISEVLNKNEFYGNIIVISLPSKMNILAFILIYLIVLSILIKLLSVMKLSSGIWTYSSSSLKYITKRDIKKVFILITVTFFCVTGVDIYPIIYTNLLKSSGISIFQLQAALQITDGIQFLLWPYNPTMLTFWNSLLHPFSKIFVELNNTLDYKYTFGYVLRVINGGLIVLTVLTILSYLIENNYIDKKNVRKAFFISIFNPATFYIACIFVQLDTLPMYLLTLGILSLKKESRFFSCLMIGLALSCKMQTLVYFPIVILILLFEFIYEKRFLLPIKSMFYLLGTLGLSFVVPFFINKSFNIVLNYAPQADRVWFTVFPYAPGLSVFISIFLLTCLTILYVFMYNEYCKYEDVLLTGLLMVGVIILSFSISIIHTPSSLLLILPALTVIIALRGDIRNNIFFVIFTILMVTSELFSDVGDISNIFSIVGKGGFFKEYVLSLEGSEQSKYISLIFTISKAAMSAYCCYFLYWCKEVLTRNIRLRINS